MDLSIFTEKAPVKAQWYTLCQNNSGGSFTRNDDVDYFVSIEAYSEEQAEAIFNSLDNEAEYWCECCGERWYWSPDVGDMPTYFDQPLLDGGIDRDCWTKQAVVMHGLNGRKARFDGLTLEEIV